MALLSRLLVLLATVLTVAIAAFLASSGQETRPSERDAYCREPCDLFRIVWVGDIMLGDAAQRELDSRGYTWPFEHVRPLLVGDYVIGNAEAPITAHRQRYFAEQRWHYNAQPPAARALAEVGFDALSLANNHALDRGPEGLHDTLEHLRAAGIRTFGAGMNDDEAAAPLLVDTPYGIVAVLGFTENWRFGAVAGPDQAGTVTFTDEAIVQSRDAARAAGARWIVAFVHWGENYAPVTARQRRVAASFARAGYDLVLGHHSHLAQQADVVDGMPIVYSLGNFVFGSTGRYTEQFPGYSVVARTYLGRDGFRALELTCILTDNDVVKHQPRPCADDQAETVLHGLGPRVTVRGGRGILEWPPGRT